MVDLPSVENHSVGEIPMKLLFLFKAHFSHNIIHAYMHVRTCTKPWQTVIMSRHRLAFKLTAIAILLATVLCVLITYLRGGVSAPVYDHPLTNFRKTILSLQPGHFMSAFYSGTNSLEVNITTGAPLQQYKYLKLLKKANKTYLLPNLTSQSIKDVETFVFFIGYPRSGHSIIASMIDAHPNAILAHEFNLFNKLATQLSAGNHYLLDKAHLFNTLYQDSYTDAIIGWRSGKSSYDKKGYSLKLNASESWQGRFRTLKIIGDKAGGSTSRVYRDHPKLFVQIYRSLVSTVRVPIRVIHVVRNPYDMIATRLLYRMSSIKRQKAQFNSTNKTRNDKIAYQAFQGLYKEVMAVRNMTRACNLTVHEIHTEEFIHNPRKQMESVCDFLGLTCSESYLTMCEQMTYKNVSRTRDSVEWSTQIKDLVETRMLQLPFFKRYSLTD